MELTPGTPSHLPPTSPPSGLRLLTRTKTWAAYRSIANPHSIHFYRNNTLHILCLWLNDRWDPRRAIPTSPPIPPSLLRDLTVKLRQPTLDA